MDFRTAAFGLHPRQIADLIGVHISTARKYLRSNQAPAWAFQLLTIHRHGRLPTDCPTWSHWRISGSFLIDPAGVEYSAGDVMSLWVVEQLKRELQLKHRAPVQYLLDV